MRSAPRQELININIMQIIGSGGWDASSEPWPGAWAQASHHVSQAQGLSKGEAGAWSWRHTTGSAISSPRRTRLSGKVDGWTPKSQEPSAPRRWQPRGFWLYRLRFIAVWCSTVKRRPHRASGKSSASERT